MFDGSEGENRAAIEKAIRHPNASCRGKGRRRQIAVPSQSYYGPNSQGPRKAGARLWRLAGYSTPAIRLGRSVRSPLRLNGTRAFQSFRRGTPLCSYQRLGVLPERLREVRRKWDRFAGTESGVFGRG